MSKYTIRDIFKIYGPEYIKTHNLSKEQWKAFNAIINCGTKKLGYHICTCEDCGEEYFGYNSCRNRHCKKYKKYSYYTVIDSEKTLSVDYCVHKSDSVVKGAFFEWMKTRLYNSNDHHIWGKTDNYEEKVEEVRQILTYLTNQVPVTITDESTYWMWTYHNLTIKLYEGGRMVMYLTEK